MRAAVATVSLALAACAGDVYDPGPLLYQAVTPGCERWLDGSRFELPKRISVFASVPVPTTDGKMELGLAYFIPRGISTTFTNQVFEVTLPKGIAVARGEVTLVDRTPPSSGQAPTVLTALPGTLVGEPDSEETMYRLRVLFSPPLPERFDFKPPDMLVEGKAYPVRTYTYRRFSDRGMVGLCS